MGLSLRLVLWDRRRELDDADGGGVQSQGPMECALAVPFAGIAAAICGSSLCARTGMYPYFFALDFAAMASADVAGVRCRPAAAFFAVSRAHPATRQVRAPAPACYAVDGDLGARAVWSTWTVFQGPL